MRCLDKCQKGSRLFGSSFGSKQPPPLPSCFVATSHAFPSFGAYHTTRHYIPDISHLVSNLMALFPARPAFRTSGCEIPVNVHHVSIPLHYRNSTDLPILQLTFDLLRVA